MHAARRVYIYLVSFISFMVLLVGATNLLRLVFELLLGVDQQVGDAAIYLRQEFSSNGALVVVGGAVWAVHWWLALRSVVGRSPDAAAERQSVLRKLLIYGVLIVAGVQVYFSLQNLLGQALDWLLSSQTPDLARSLSDEAARIIANGLAWLLFWRIRAADNARELESGGAATVRRWYFYAVSFASLPVLLYATTHLALFLWQLLTAGLDSGLIVAADLPGALPGDISRILVGGAFWLGHWLWVQGLVRVSADEQHSLLRKVHIYGMILQTVTVTLFFLATLLYNLLRLALGGATGSGAAPLLTQFGDALIPALIYGAFWIYHRRVLTADAALVAAEAPQHAAIRQLYNYLVALIGLALLALGVGSVLRLLIDLALGGSVTTSATQSVWADLISQAVTLIAVGLPVWLINWQRVQRRARTAAGFAARQSPIRRVYVYIVLFAGVIALLASAGWLIYRLFLYIGGESITADVLSTTAVALAAALTAVGLLVYHVGVLLGDGRVVSSAPPATALVVRPAPPRPVTSNTTPLATETIVLLRGYNPLTLSAAVAGLRANAPGGADVAVFPAGHVTPHDITAWLEAHAAPPPPAEPESTA